MSAGFVHLRLHSEYSLIDGLVRVKELVERAVELGMPAVALTDHTNLFALIKFYKEAQSAGIKPIVGCDVRVEHEGQTHALTLLVGAQEGYRNLIRLISRGWLEGQQLGRPVLQRAWVEEFAGGLIALSGGREGDIGQALLGGRAEQAVQLLDYWMAAVPGALLSRGEPHRPSPGRGLPASGGRARRTPRLPGGGDQRRALPRSQTTSRPTRRGSASTRAAR